MNKVYVPGKGNASAKIAIIGEAPSHSEVEALTPFVGPSGKFLNSLLAEAGISRDSCWRAAELRQLGVRIIYITGSED